MFSDTPCGCNIPFSPERNPDRFNTACGGVFSYFAAGPAEEYILLSAGFKSPNKFYDLFLPAAPGRFCIYMADGKRFHPVLRARS
jgi:superfamily I DNA and RNA helicase